MDFIVNFYKPPGMSSAQAVAFLKAKTGAKAGHAGTLDPEAAGVLPILLGKATRLCDFLPDDKRYLAEIAFGAATDTQDAQGKVIRTGGNVPNLAALASVLPRFIGDITQLPPQYSALKVVGQAAYKLAREGKNAPLAPRPVHIESIDVIREMPKSGFLLRVKCGKGTYIRSLCHDIGQALGCPAHMRFLLREVSGGLSLETAASPEDIVQWAAGGFSGCKPWIIPMDEAISHLPSLHIPIELTKPAVNGAKLPVSAIPGSEAIFGNANARLYLSGALLGVYRRENGVFACDVMLRP